MPTPTTTQNASWSLDRSDHSEFELALTGDSRHDSKKGGEQTLLTGDSSRHSIKAFCLMDDIDEDHSLASMCFDSDVESWAHDDSSSSEKADDDEEEEIPEDEIIHCILNKVDSMKKIAGRGQRIVGSRYEKRDEGDSYANSLLRQSDSRGHRVVKTTDGGATRTYYSDPLMAKFLK